ncbi:MAG: hypothetical protein AB8B83_07080 [Bdellovibrionales bacterium]
MTFSKPFIIALAALPLATATINSAEAKPRCKNYKTVVNGPGKNYIASARVCRNEYDEWHFKRLTGPYKAREKLVKRVYHDLLNKEYGVLVGYGQYYDDRDYRHSHNTYSQRPYRQSSYKQRHRYSNQKRYPKCDY